ncbi:MAG: hypothetical protein ACC649_08975, partial [Myxococcota bacterium]
MKRSLALISAFLFVTAPNSTQASDSTQANDASAAKQEAVASIDRQATDMAELSDQIWTFAETALRETRSAALLADYAEAQGFEVERGVAGMPTAFVASYGCLGLFGGKIP